MIPANPTLKIGFSPCPNDTFIFDALVHEKIDTDGLKFKVFLEDVQSLNTKAFSSQFDVTKLSFFAYSFLSDKYQLLNSGAALGSGVGPLLISKKKFKDPGSEIKTVAIPGKHTTANFLLTLFYPDFTNKVEMLFSDIENAVLNDEVDAGVIIHENRFTYEQKGLLKIRDLGTNWEETTGMAIPLGGIAVKRELPENLKYKIDTLLRKSVEFALSNPSSSKSYVKSHSQEMEDDVIRQHISLYVNKSSIDLGTEGRKAIHTLYQKANKIGLIERLHEPIFLEVKDISCK